MTEETDRLFQLRIDPETEDMLDQLAAADDRSKSAEVRWLIRQAFSQATPKKQSDPQKPEQ